MKNILHNIQIGMMLALTMASIQSCSDELQDVDDVLVSFTATLPTDTHARSFGKAEQVNTLVVGVFNGEEEIYRRSFTVNNTSVDVQLALAKNQTYSFIFWAYDENLNIYDITDLKAIKMNTLPNPITFDQAESMDAFFAVEKNITITGSNNNYPVELVRPLAQINIGTTGTPEAASFTVEAPDTFHPFTNIVEGEFEYKWEFNETSDKKFTIDGTDYNYLVLAYLFAPIHGTKVNATLTRNGTETPLNEVNIQANLRTNIGVQ